MNIFSKKNTNIIIKKDEKDLHAYATKRPCCRCDWQIREVVKEIVRYRDVLHIKNKNNKNRIEFETKMS